MRVLIGADIVPTKNNIDIFEAGDLEGLVGKELARVMCDSDFNILNLETPLTDKLSPIVKAGENFAAPKRTISGLRAINPHFYGLANNHILDQGDQGLVSTINLLKASGIGCAGAGMTAEEAARPYIKRVSGVNIGIYLCAEHEYSVVTREHGGANPYDPLYSFDHVRQLRENCDLCIVLFHGGIEYYRYPSPQLRRVFKRFAESGADVIVAQHTHCIGCMEKFMDSLLVYGQGNFLFDDSDKEIEKTSLLVQISTDGKNHDYSFIPLVKDKYTVKKTDSKSGEIILREFSKRSELITKEGVIEEKFYGYTKQQARGYLTGISGGFGRFFPIRVINKMCSYRLSERMYSGKLVLPLENYINCETHREVLQEACRILRT